MVLSPIVFAWTTVVFSIASGNLTALIIVAAGCVKYHAIPLGEHQAAINPKCFTNGLKSLSAKKQGKLPLNAKRGDYRIDRLANRDAFFTESPKVIRTSDCHILSD